MKRNIYFYFTAILSVAYILLLLAKPLFKNNLAEFTDIVPEYGIFLHYHIQLLFFLIPMLLISIIEYFRLKLPSPNKKLSIFLWFGTFLPMIFLFLSFLIIPPPYPRRYYRFDIDETETVFSLFDFLAKNININALITISVMFFGVTQIIRVGELLKSLLIKKS